MLYLDFKKYEKELEPRMKKLFDNKQFLELFTFMSYILEKQMQETISSYEELMKAISSKYGIGFSIKEIYNKDKLTLGQLNRYLSVYCNNKELLGEIENFNRLRVRIIHNVFLHDINDIEKEIENYYPEGFFRLLTKLSRIDCRSLEKTTLLLKEEISRYKKYI